jgi:hypothetical protein
VLDGNRVLRESLDQQVTTSVTVACANVKAALVARDVPEKFATDAARVVAETLTAIGRQTSWRDGGIDGPVTKK